MAEDDDLDENDAAWRYIDPFSVEGLENLVDALQPIDPALSESETD